jgi:hypothetical protein
MYRPTLLLLALAACDPWTDRNVQNYGYLDAALWDPAGLVATTDGLYVPLPNDGGLVLLAPGEEATHLRLGDGYLQRLQVAPDQQTVLAFSHLYRCVDHEGDKEPVTIEDCEGEVTTSGELTVVRAGATVDSVPLGLWYGPLTISDDSTYAVAAIDPYVSTTGGGIVNLTSLFVLDLTSMESWEVAVGFASDRVLFTTDGAGATTGAVVLSESEVALVDLASRASDPRVVFPLTLDPDDLVEPVGVSLTPSGEHALISVQGSDDLYALDLVNPSVNILSLAGRPSAMAVDATVDKTVLVYRNAAKVELLDHERFELTTVDLDESMGDIALSGDGLALLYDLGGSKDAYRFDLSTQVLHEYRLNWSPQTLHVAPDFSFAVSLPSEPFLEVLDLSLTSEGVDTSPKRFGLDGRGVGIAFATTDTGSAILVLQEGEDTLYQLSWPDLGLSALDLPAPPLGVGTLPDGTFWITHDAALGLVSFYTPGEELRTVGGFGHHGLHGERLLVPEEE